jgi:hypothetical protein
MENEQIRSQKALILMLIILVIGIGSVVFIAQWKAELFKNIYLADDKTFILNGIIILLFFMGIVQLIRGFHHYAFEEKQVKTFVQNKEEGIREKDLLVNLAKRSIIANRYFTIKDLFDRKIPINHSAISSIMVAEESLYQSFPKFVNNVLILTGVFGTIISLIFALVGASSVLKTSVPGEGMGLMLSGMNTALTTTATAIICFFFFTFFYQKLTDVQTYLFGQIEKAVLIHIIPDFAFDSEAVSYKTELLVRELRKLVSELKAGTNFIETSLSGVNDHNKIQIDRLDALLARQDNQIQKTEGVITRLEDVQEVLKDGFRLKQ